LAPKIKKWVAGLLFLDYHHHVMVGKKTFLVLAAVVIMFVISGLAFAQRPNNATMVDRYDPSSESVEVFEAKAKLFIKILDEADKDTTAALSTYVNSECALALDRLLEQRPDLRRRISFFHAGIKYRGEWKNVEFWLIPPGSDSPFPPFCALCSCPSLSVSGSAAPGKEGRVLVFTANISADVTYRWTVMGGQIVKGQGTASISVKPDGGDHVEAKVEVEGLDPSCNCVTESSSILNYPYQ
jgi:PKD-like domain